MPTPQLKKLAEKTGKTLSEVEKDWQKAKEQADKKFTKKDERYWSYVSGTTQKMAGARHTAKK